VTMGDEFAVETNCLELVFDVLQKAVYERIQ
jgi:hypothetical protein